MALGKRKAPGCLGGEAGKCLQLTAVLPSPPGVCQMQPADWPLRCWPGVQCWPRVGVQE